MYEILACLIPLYWKFVSLWLVISVYWLQSILTSRCESYNWGVLYKVCQLFKDILQNQLCRFPIELGHFCQCGQLMVPYTIPWASYTQTFSTFLQPEGKSHLCSKYSYPICAERRPTDVIYRQQNIWENNRKSKEFVISGLQEEVIQHLRLLSKWRTEPLNDCRHLEQCRFWPWTADEL